MLSSICGEVLSVEQNQVEIEVKSLGLAFNLLVPMAAKFRLHAPVRLFTYLHWNQEQGPTLFGFEEAAQRKIFMAAIGCTGVGPKMALAILEQLGVSGLITAVSQQDLKQLSSVSGIGPKKAEQIIVQLKHKLDKLIESSDFANLAGFAHFNQVRSVLLSLSYSNTEVVQALDYLKQIDLGQGAGFDLALRQALSFLAKNV